MMHGHIPRRYYGRVSTILVFSVGVALAPASPGYSGEAADLWSDTWVATDSLGRSLPLVEEVGPRRANKFVGVFYFLWLGQSGDLGPFDVTRILAQDPTALRNP